jgi:hypothetical protein
MGNKRMKERKLSWLQLKSKGLMGIEGVKKTLQCSYHLAQRYVEEHPDFPRPAHIQERKRLYKHSEVLAFRRKHIDKERKARENLELVHISYQTTRILNLTKKFYGILNKHVYL